MPVHSPFADCDIPAVDQWTRFMEWQPPYPSDHALFVDGETNRSYNHAQIKSLSKSFGQGLAYNFKWQRGDTLALYCGNHIDVPVVNLGNHWAGGISSPANPTYTAEDLARQLKDSRARLLVTQKAVLDIATRAAQLAALPVENILLLGDDRDETGRFRHWTEITADAAWIKPRRPAVTDKDIACLVYSSGTTGLPKGVVLTHRNVLSNNAQGYKIDSASLNWETDTQLGVLPFYHIYGLSVIINITLSRGTKCVILPRWDTEKACQLIQDHRVSFIYAAPPMILALGKHPAVPKYDFSSIRWINSGAAPCSADLIDTVWDRLKVGVKQGYGLSETSPTLTAQIPEEWRRFQGSVGRLYPNIQAKIIDPDGKELPVGESGELLVKGPNVFSGYWNRPELAKDTFDAEGYYKTGDVGYFDKSGNLYITDRIKELIKYKGYQVPPAELEAKLLARNDIADACVIGVWDDKEHTEVPRAYVVPSADANPDEELAKDIQQWFSSVMAPHKKLRGGIHFVREIPKAASGKILRRVFKDQLKKEDRGGPKAKL